MLQFGSSTLQKFLVWSVVLLLLLNIHVNAQTKVELTKKLNCRKFIFAPRCRGVAAKRNYAISSPIVSAQSSDESERNYMNRNRDRTDRDLLLNYILSRIEARSLLDNDVNVDSAEDLSSYR